jgi:hydrogenase expression/formation protein HypC
MCLGIPGKVVKLYEVNGMKMAKIDFSGVIKEACMEYLPEIKVGDYTIMDEKEANEILQLLNQIAAVEEEG